jgi:hypothetical protein
VGWYGHKGMGELWRELEAYWKHEIKRNKEANKQRKEE